MLYSTIPLLLSAGSALVQSTHCNYQGVEYAAFTQSEMPGMVAVFVTPTDSTRSTSPTDLETQTIAAAVQPPGASVAVRLPSYWPGAQEIPSSACSSSGSSGPNIQTHATTGAPSVWMFWSLDYFISGDSFPPGETLADLIRAGDALPVQLRVLCVARGEGATPAACEKLELMDQYAPINPTHDQFDFIRGSYPR